jgi:hypothetical protein
MNGKARPRLRAEAPAAGAGAGRRRAAAPRAYHSLNTACCGGVKSLSLTGRRRAAAVVGPRPPPLPPARRADVGSPPATQPLATRRHAAAVQPATESAKDGPPSPATFATRAPAPAPTAPSPVPPTSSAETLRRNSAGDAREQWCMGPRSYVLNNGGPPTYDCVEHRWPALLTVAAAVGWAGRPGGEPPPEWAQDFAAARAALLAVPAPPRRGARLLIGC